MAVRTATVIACVVVASLAGAALLARDAAAPACDSDRTQAQIYRALRDRFHLQSVFLHDFSLVSGSYFSATRACAAEVAEIRGNVDAAALPWRQLHYRVMHSAGSDDPEVTVDLGGATAFAAQPAQTLWTRLLAFF